MSSVFYTQAPKITHLSDIPRPVADPSLCSYSAECVEGSFSELRQAGVFRSAPRKNLLQLYLLSREPYASAQVRFLPSV